MLHANVRCSGRCSLSIKLASVFLLTFGSIWLIRTALQSFQWPSSFSSVSVSWIPDAHPRTLTSSYCRPKTNIFFLKTHKCASSTVQNIFLRYGSKNGLNFVLPSLGNYLGNQAPFHRSMAATAPWHRLGYNIFCHHTVFNRPEIAAVMPTDTIYVTIVRHPVTLFESLYEYADLGLRYHQTFQQFVHQRSPGLTLSTDRAQGYLGVNQMAYDLGIKPSLFDDPVAIEREIQRLHRQFDLVLLAEHFEQSMVLLADRLCWDLDKVTYFKHNSRKSKSFRVNKTTSEKIETLNSADMKIYRFFERVFEHQIQMFGGWDKLEEQVQRLRRLNEDIEKFCYKSNNSDKQQLAFQADKIEQLSVGNSNGTCQDMSLNEIAFTRRLKMAQMMKVGKKLGVKAIRTGPIATGFNVGDIGRPMVPNMWQQLSRELGFTPIQTVNMSLA